MLQLPPLNALKAFESAARNGGFVAAAAELNVTAAAVSQQVRNLETFYGRKLFRRLNNRIVLTDAGQAILAGVTPALEEISALTKAVMFGGSRASLVISVIPSLAECWFMPVFAAYAPAREGLQIELRVEADPVDFTTGEIDLRIGYGAPGEPGLEVVPLFRDQVLPVCAPKLARAMSLAVVDDSLLIHTRWGRSFASHPGWEEWFARYSPGRQIDPRNGPRVGTSQLALDFAMRGLGVALGQHHLAAEMISAGKLVILADHALALGQDYCAVFPAAKKRKSGVMQLLAYLRSTPHPVRRAAREVGR